MMTVQITLPDQLAQEAERAGLLSPEFVEKWLRDQLKTQRVDQLFAAMDRMSAVESPTAMSPKAVAEEMATMRSERVAKDSTAPSFWTNS
jgi:Arc/MetJ family transcription regulator